ncbi:MAG TPA: glycosyltransferase [Pyrinomonadaceae bacterium]|jgi:glycosyltransferase involved in cell wall biosynthesis|nr:glycosyltransferase [Pyrinomonadaceae bacterium]
MSTSAINPTPTTEITPRVSVIIPAYKVAPFIRETLESVFAQTFTDFEAIVINDDSPDTPQLEQTLESYSGKIVYLKQPNRGAGAARNSGLRVARGEYVAFLDGDDVWLPEFLTEQLKLIQSKGGYDLAYADAINFGEQGYDNATNMSYNPSYGEVTFLKLLCGECSIVTSTVLARREPIMRVGCFDERFVNSQDFDLWLRLARDANARITYQQKVLARRRIYRGSLASDPLRSFAGELSVLNNMRGRDDLTAAEREALENTLRKRQATVEVLKGKQELTVGDFKKAAESFAEANKYWPSRKLEMVLICMRFAPRVLQRVYQMRRT